MPALSPLDLPAPYRWAALPRSRRMHRIARLAVTADKFMEWPNAQGQTMCRRFGRLSTPGLGDRLDGARCAHCCRRVGIPRGYGAPFNALAGEDREK